MAKNNFLLEAQKRNISNMRDYGFIARVQVLDKVTIALGRMGMSPECIAEFEQEYLKAEQDYCQEVVVDGMADKQLVYSRAKIDEALSTYVAPEHFVPYEERYDTKTENYLRKLCFGVDWEVKHGNKQG